MFLNRQASGQSWDQALVVGPRERPVWAWGGCLILRVNRNNLARTPKSSGSDSLDVLLINPAQTPSLTASWANIQPQHPSPQPLLQPALRSDQIAVLYDEAAERPSIQSPSFLYLHIVTQTARRSSAPCTLSQAHGFTFQDVMA